MARATIDKRGQERLHPASGPIAPRGQAHRQYSRVRIGVALTDLLVVEGSVFLAWLAVSGTRPLPLSRWVLLLLLPLINLAVFGSFRLYSLTRVSPAEEFRRILAASAVSIASLVFVAFWSRSNYPRPFVALVWAMSLLLTLVSRRLWHFWMWRARARGKLTFRTLIVGTNDEAHGLVSAMRHPSLGFHVVGGVTTAQSIGGLDGHPIFGDVTRLQEAIRESSADCVFVASTAVTPGEMNRVTKAVRLQGVEVRVSANLSEILSTRLTVQPLGSVMALSLKPVRLTGLQRLAKRTLDVSVGSIALLVLSPVWLVVAVAIKLDSRGSVFYRQERVGQRSRPFKMLKFRTMVQGADMMLDDLRSQNEATGPLFKLRADPRTTRVGKRLRRWSLDEFPQLWNVLIGEMSLVGPRPPLPEEVARYEDWHFDRLEVPPGITGLWQVRGRSTLPFDDYVRMDLFYIENWSIAYDLFILAKTIPVVLSRKGAF